MMCQRCGIRTNDWNIKQAKFNVGEVQHWTTMLCEHCTEVVTQAVLDALQPPKKSAPPEGRDQ